MAEVQPYDKFFKYIYSTIMYLISFSLMASDVTELIGLSLGIVVNLITNVFLFIDINNSPKSMDSVVLVLLMCIITLTISTMFVIKMLSQLHTKYAPTGAAVNYTREGRNYLDKFKTLFTWDVILISVTSLMFFMSYRYTNVNNKIVYTPYYNTKFDGDSVTVFRDFLVFLFKVLSSMAMLGISGYIVFVANHLSTLHASDLYIPDEPEEVRTVINRRNSYINAFMKPFSNLSLNYITNYKKDLML